MAARTTASRSTSQWTSRRSPTATPAVSRDSPSRCSWSWGSCGRWIRLAPSGVRSWHRSWTDAGVAREHRYANPARSRDQADGRREDRAHPDQGAGGGAAAEAAVDPRARAVVATLLRDQADPAGEPASYGLRGSLVP